MICIQQCSNGFYISGPDGQQRVFKSLEELVTYIRIVVFAVEP